MSEDTAARFYEKVDVTPGCWLWTGWQSGRDAKAGLGYGMFCHDGVRELAHRWSYCHHKGEIPEGLQIDHLCKVKRCVNPDHLEAVTPHENMARLTATQPFQLRATHCANGHEYTAENRYEWNDQVKCRDCRRTHDKAMRERDPKRYDRIRREAKARRAHTDGSTT